MVPGEVLNPSVVSGLFHGGMLVAGFVIGAGMQAAATHTDGDHGTSIIWGIAMGGYGTEWARSAANAPESGPMGMFFGGMFAGSCSVIALNAAFRNQ